MEGDPNAPKYVLISILSKSYEGSQFWWLIIQKPPFHVWRLKWEKFNEHHQFRIWNLRLDKQQP